VRASGFLSCAKGGGDLKKAVSAEDATDEFSGFPVVLCSVGGEKDNIITLALCHVFSFKPPLVGIGVAPKRFSYGLLKKSKDFAVNIPTRQQLEPVKVCGSKSGRRVDKFEAARLTREKASRISSPLVAECPVNLECVKVDELETGDHTWFVGEVVAARRDESYDKADMLLYWGDYRVIGEKVD
jgi:flavin reductase (DIM6/NTAB) family NADH-FMN oxidoreductase RutF